MASKLLKAVLVGVALGASAVCNATVIDEGNATSFIVSGNGSNAPTQDDYLFNIGSTSNFSFLANNVTGMVIGALGSGGSYLAAGPIVTGTSFQTTLGAGSYFAEFFPKAGSAYSGTVTISPVPEPYEWALMVAGLGFVVRAARSKKQDA